MEQEKGSKFWQYFAAIAGNFGIMAGAALSGWANPMLKKLQADDPIAPDNPLGYAITSDDASWIASLPIISASIGVFLFGHLAKRWGRKKILLISIVPYSISIFTIATAKSVITLLISRIFVGVAGGASLAILPMYTAEISETSIRGVLGSFIQVFMNIGWLFSYCIGPFTSYTTFWLCCSVLPIIFFVAVCFIPESPVYLAAQGKQREVIKVLAKLRGKNYNSVEKEANEILKNVQANAKIDTNILDLVRVKNNFRALLLCCGLFTFQGLSGILVVLNYAQIIFDAAGETEEFISPAVSTIIIGVVQLASCCITPFFIDYWGRRILLIISGIGGTLGLFALGLYFMIANSENGNVSSISWLPVTSLMIFIAAYSLGWGGVPWVILSEMFNSDIKGKAFGFATLWMNIVVFLTIKFFPLVVDTIGMHYTFWIFAVISLIGIGFIVFILPETKGKSLALIQAELAGHLK